MTFAVKKRDMNEIETELWRGYLPIFCGSLNEGWCPLEKDEYVSYSGSFQLENPKMTFSPGSPQKLIFKINLFRILQNGSWDEIYSFSVKISLEGCYFYQLLC